MTEAVENECTKVGLYMNVGKCKVLVSKDWRDDIEINIGRSAVETVEDLCYLGSRLMNNSSCDKDCQTRIGKATSAFGRLKPVWKNKHISLALQCRIMASICHTKEEVGNGTPHVPTTDTGHLMEEQCTKWERQVEDNTADIKSHSQRKKTLIWWLRHVLRMDDSRLP